MGLPVVFRKTLAAASVNNIATAQSGTAATKLTLNGSAASGGIATLDSQRRVLITSAGNDSGITFRIRGTDDSGAQVNEILTGGNIAAVASALNYKAITSIVPSGNTASTVQVGTNTVGSTPWAIYNAHLTQPDISLAFDVISGAVNATAEYTFDEIMADTVGAAPVNAPPSRQPIVRGITGMVAMAAQMTQNIVLPFRGYRLTVNSGTGVAQLVGTQAGVSDA